MNECVRGQSIYRVATALNAVTSCSSQTRAAPCSGACFIENSSPGGHSRYSASQSVSAVLSNFHMYYFHWEREREGKCWIRAYNPAKLWHQSAEALNQSKQPWQWLTAAGDEERRQLRGRRRCAAASTEYGGHSSSWWMFWSWSQIQTRNHVRCDNPTFICSPSGVPASSQSSYWSSVPGLLIHAKPSPCCFIHLWAQWLWRAGIIRTTCTRRRERRPQTDKHQRDYKNIWMV